MEQLDDSPLGLLSLPKRPVNGKKQKDPVENIPQTKKGASQIDEQNTLCHIKERMTVQISKATIERVKDCVYWNRITVAQFVEEALEAALKEAEMENGKPFQRRRSELKPGRPTK